MSKRKTNDALLRSIEWALNLGHFVSYNQSWRFVQELQEIKHRIDVLVKQGEARRAVDLYEIFISGCYEKAEEIDDSGGNLGMFAQELFLSWIKARQKAGCRPEETVKLILHWRDNDNYGFCYNIEGEVAKTLNKEGLLLFCKHFQTRFAEAYAPFQDQAPKYIYDYPPEVYMPVRVLKAIYIAKQDIKSYLALGEKIATSPKDCENIATLYKAKGRFADALEWTEKGLALEKNRQWHNQSSFGLEGMRRELLGKVGRKEDALKAAWSEFERSPGIYFYEDLMKYIPKKDFRTWHEKALQQAKKGNLSGFIEICVKTKERELLSSRIDSAKHEELEQISHYIMEKAVKALARNYQQTTAKVHRALGMRIIKRGKSKYYPYALEHFQKAKKLYEQNGQTQKWSVIVGSIRKNHSRKYSFISAFEAIVSGKRLESPDSFESRIRKRWKKQTSS